MRACARALSVSRLVKIKRRGPWEDGPRLATDVAISGEGLRDDQSSLVKRCISNGCEEHERCEEACKLLHCSDFRIELVVSVLTKRCR